MFLQKYFLIPIILFFIIISIQLIIGIYSNLKRNHDKEKLQHLNFRISKFSNALLLGPIYKSILQVFMIFGSNFKKKKSLVYLMLIFLFAGGFIAVVQMEKTNIPYLIRQDVYFDATEIHSSFYKSENSKLSLLLAPEIESDKIESNSLKIFIPIYSNEKNFRESFCGSFVSDTTKSRQENRILRRQHDLDCYHKYNIVYLNGEKLNVEYLKYEYPRTEQFGIVTYIDVSNTKLGINNLTIKKEFGSKIDSEWTIPF